MREKHLKAHRLPHTLSLGRVGCVGLLTKAHSAFRDNHKAQAIPPSVSRQIWRRWPWSRFLLCFASRSSTGRGRVVHSISYRYQRAGMYRRRRTEAILGSFRSFPDDGVGRLAIDAISGPSPGAKNRRHRVDCSRRVAAVIIRRVNSGEIGKVGVGSGQFGSPRLRICWASVRSGACQEKNRSISPVCLRRALRCTTEVPSRAHRRTARNAEASIPNLVAPSCLPSSQHATPAMKTG